MYGLSTTCQKVIANGTNEILLIFTHNQIKKSIPCLLLLTNYNDTIAFSLQCNPMKILATKTDKITDNERILIK